VIRAAQRGDQTGKALARGIGCGFELGPAGIRRIAHRRPSGLQRPAQRAQGDLRLDAMEEPAETPLEREAGARAGERVCARTILIVPDLEEVTVDARSYLGEEIERARRRRCP